MAEDENASWPVAGPVVLVAADFDASDARAFAEHMTRQGGGFLAAASLAALKRLGARLRPPAVAVLDDRHPDADAVRRWLKVSPARARARLLTYNDGADGGRAVDRLRVRADAALESGLDAGALRRVLDALPRGGADGGGDGAHTVRWEFPGQPKYLSPVREWLDALLGHSALAKPDRTLFGIGVMEAVDNVRHDTLDRFARVCMAYSADRDEVAVEVSVDPCPPRPGFAPHRDFRADAADAVELVRARVRQGGRGGVGLMLLHRCADHVRYDPDRHAVTLWKFPARTARSAVNAHERPDKTLSS